MAEFIRYVAANTYGMGVYDSLSSAESIIHEVLCHYPSNDEHGRARAQERAYNIGAIPLKKENLYIVYSKEEPVYEKPCAIIDGIGCFCYTFIVVKRIRNKIVSMNDEEVKYAMNIEFHLPTDEEESKSYKRLQEDFKIIEAFRETEGKIRFSPHLRF